MIELLWVVWGEDYLSRAAGAVVQSQATTNTSHRIVYYGQDSRMYRLCIDRGLNVQRKNLPRNFKNTPGSLDLLRIEEFGLVDKPTIYCDSDVYWLKPLPFDESLYGPLNFGYSIYGYGPGQDVEDYVMSKWGVPIVCELEDYEENTFYAVEGHPVSPIWSRVVPNIGMIWMKDGDWVRLYAEIYKDLLGVFPGVFGLGEFALSIFQKEAVSFKSMIWPGINRMPMYNMPWHHYLIDARFGNDEIFVTDSSEIAFHTSVYSCPDITPSIKLGEDGLAKVNYYE
jgi:hypothetical protein